MVRGFQRRTFGANEYLVAFGGGATAPVKLKEIAGWVCLADYENCNVPALDAVATDAESAAGTAAAAGRNI